MVNFRNSKERSNYHVARSRKFEVKSVNLIHMWHDRRAEEERSTNRCRGISMANRSREIFLRKERMFTKQVASNLFRSPSLGQQEAEHDSAMKKDWIQFVGSRL